SYIERNRQRCRGIVSLPTRGLSPEGWFHETTFGVPVERPPRCRPRRGGTRTAGQGRRGDPRAAGARLPPTGQPGQGPRRLQIAPELLRQHAGQDAGRLAQAPSGNPENLE